MQNQNTKINFLVGLFVLGGIVALLFLALQAASADDPLQCPFAYRLQH